MAYNHGGKPQALMGNWFEDRRLIEAGVSEEKLAKTSTRVLNAEGSYRGVQSQARDAHNYTKHAAEFEGIPLPPRARARLARMQREAAREAEEVLEAAQARVDNARYLTSTQQDAFVQHDRRLYAEATGARVMKTQEGAPLPKDARDVDFAVSCGLMAPRATITQAALAAALPPAEHEATLGATRGAGGLAAAGDAPISIYSHRLAEGVFPGSEAINRVNPFARSAAFTNELGDPVVGHADAPDKPVGIRKLGTAMALGPGSGLALGEVLDRVRIALARKYGSLEVGAEALSDAMQHSARVAAGGRHVDPASAISLSILRDGLKRLGVPLAERDLASVYRFFDTDESGAVSPGELLAGLRGEADVELGVASTVRVGGDASGAPFAATAASTVSFSPSVTGGGGVEHTGPTALLRVLFTDAREELIRIADPIGLGPDDVPAMKARLRREGVTGVHTVTLVKE